MPLGTTWMFTDAFLRVAYGIEKREGEFDLCGITWRVRDTITDDQGRVTYRCERVR